MSKDEREALNKLIKNENIIIKKADKGGATVLMNKTDYIREAHRQLHNIKYYKKLDAPVYKNNIFKINEVLREMLDHGYIEHGQYQYLSAKDSSRARIFYLLPKIHKPRDKWPNPKMPEGRPVVSDCNSESYRVSEYIDHFLQPLSTKNDAYIKDTYDFLSKVRGQKIAKNAFFVTADVTALYTNMDLKRTLEVVREIFREFPDPCRPDEYLIKLLEITLLNNDFEFNSEFYLQILGIAMGKRYAPSLANIYLRHFDKRAKLGLGGVFPQLYFRFIDDIHFVWTGTEAELKEFESYLNGLIPGIKISFEYSVDSVHFLDVTLYKKQFDENYDVIQSKVYFKETDSHQLLDKTSFHPKHTTRGVLKSQLLRFKRISSCYADYREACAILFHSLRQRGYSERLLRSMRGDVWKSDNLKLFRNDDTELLPIVVPFNEIGVKLAKKWREFISENERFREFRLITAYNNGPSLQKKLVRSDLNARRIPSKNRVRTSSHGIVKNASFRCTSTKCKACNCLIEGKTFESTATGQKFKIKGRLSCSSTNVVYLVTCAACAKQYVGETGRKVADRINDHLSSIRSKKPTPIGLHFNLRGHNISHFRLMPIQRLDISETSKDNRLTIELKWQNLLRSTYPNGINQFTNRIAQALRLEQQFEDNVCTQVHR